MQRNEYLTQVKAATAAAAAYYNTDQQTLTDEQYDRLVETLAEVGAQNGWTEHVPLTTAVAAGTAVVTAGAKEVTHSNRMLSLLNASTPEKVAAFIKKFPTGTKVIYEAKFDGLAISAKYANGELVSVSTRGDGNTADELLDTIKQYVSIAHLPNMIPYSGGVEVRGEVFLTKSGLIAANEHRTRQGQEPYTLERSAASGAVRSQKDVKYVPLQFAAYDVYSDQTFATYSDTMNWARTQGFLSSDDYITPSDETDPQEIIRSFGEARHTLDIPVDGMVLKLDSFTLRKTVGEGSRHPYWAIAYKYPSLTTQTIFRGVERSIGKTGAVTYRLKFDKTLLAGSNIDTATGNNADHINNLDLHIGDTIVLQKARDIIPEVTEVITALRPEGAQKWVPPTTCPVCEEPLDITSSTVWRCLDPECAILNRIKHAVSRDCLDIDALSNTRVELLVDAGYVTTPADILTLTHADIANLETGGMKQDPNLPAAQRATGPKVPITIGDTIATTITNAITQRLETTTLPAALRALGIRNLGKTLSQYLADNYTHIDTIMALTLQDWLNFRPRDRKIAETIATRIYHTLQANTQTINKMKEAGLKAFTTTYTPAVAAPAAAGGKLEGEIVCVSGSIPGYPNRAAAEALITSHGGTTSSSVNSRTTILVTDPASTSSKAVKARELGTRIIAPEEFLNLLT